MITAFHHETPENNPIMSYKVGNTSILPANLSVEKKIFTNRYYKKLRKNS